MAIRTLREAAGLKQYELAELMDLEPASVSAWESGQAYPSVKNLMKLADILHCSTDALLGRECASA